jgi:hypothetical protein
MRKALWGEIILGPHLRFYFDFAVVMTGVRACGTFENF